MLTALFQTSQNILSQADNKDVTDELLCCLAEELLTLEEKDINSSGTKNTSFKMQNTHTKEEENMMNGDGAIVNSALEKVKVISCNLLVPLSHASTQVWMKDRKYVLINDQVSFPWASCPLILPVLS